MTFQGERGWRPCPRRADGISSNAAMTVDLVDARQSPTDPRATNNASQISASRAVGLGSLWLSLGATSWVIPGEVWVVAATAPSKHPKSPVAGTTTDRH
jgi:hypothetical protein